MSFDEALARVLDLLQRQGRVSYRALKRRFDLDDDYLEDLKAEIIKAQREQARVALSTAIALYRTMEMYFWIPQAETALMRAESQ